MAEKASSFRSALTNAPSGDDVAWGLEGADNAILAASVSGAVAAGVYNVRSIESDLNIRAGSTKFSRLVLRC